MPRGWWHEVQSVNEPSLHLTIGLPVNTAMDLIHWALPVLARQDFLRDNLPVFGDRATRRVHRRKMMEAIAAALHDDILDDYFRSVDAESRPAFANPTLPWSAMAEGALPADSNTLVRFMGLGWTPTESDPGKNVFAFRSLTRDWSFPHAAHRFLRPLLDGQALSLARVRQLAEGTLSRDEVDRLLSRAVWEGLFSFG
jgi:hypothetical protein